jgi:hypothetical protein
LAIELAKERAHLAASAEPSLRTYPRRRPLVARLTRAHSRRTQPLQASQPGRLGGARRTRRAHRPTHPRTAHPGRRLASDGIESATPLALRRPRCVAWTPTHHASADRCRQSPGRRQRCDAERQLELQEPSPAIRGDTPLDPPRLVRWTLRLCATHADRCGLELGSDRRSGASFGSVEAWESRLSRSPLWSVLERAGLSLFGGRDSRIDDEGDRRQRLPELERVQRGSHKQPMELRSRRKAETSLER